ncbi:hypothetical protein [Halorussus ruber]|uniref:hypothetical protein n=1 Tax=Halorussus ruber TaxID=1126238 RepID=UPI00143D35BE|nr:hypothetical protein [Halorussus ruber]
MPRNLVRRKRSARAGATLCRAIVARGMRTAGRSETEAEDRNRLGRTWPAVAGRLR